VTSVWVQRQERFNLFWREAPDDRTTPFTHRQEGQRAAAGETLVGDMVMRLLGRDIGDQRGLAIVGVPHGNASLVTQTGTPAIGCHHQPCAEIRVFLSAADADAGRLVAKVDALHHCRTDQVEIPALRKRTLERLAECAVFHNPPERFDPGVGMAQARKPETPAVGNMDAVYGRGPARLYPLPYAERVEDAFRAIRQGHGPVVITRLRV